MSSLPREFQHALSFDQTLYDTVTASQEQAFEDEYHLDVQVRLARQVLADNLEMWTKARSDENVQNNHAAKAMLANQFNEALESYLSIVERIVRINRTISEHISVHSVFAVFRQVERILHREVRVLVSDEQAARIKRIIQNEVTVPGLGGQADDIVEAPAKIARMMDSSIPTSE